MILHGLDRGQFSCKENDLIFKIIIRCYGLYLSGKSVVGSINGLKKIDSPMSEPYYGTLSFSSTIFALTRKEARRKGCDIPMKREFRCFQNNTTGRLARENLKVKAGWLIVLT